MNFRISLHVNVRSIGQAAFGENGARIGYGILMPKAPARTWGHNGETRAYGTEWVVWPDTQEAVVILASNKAAPTPTIRRELVAQTWSGQSVKTARVCSGLFQ